MITPTDEQLEAMRLFGAGQSLGIEALAGTGKTTTLQLLGNNRRSCAGQYVSFNADIVKDAGARMPENVKSNTAHSLANRSFGYQKLKLLIDRKMSSAEKARAIGAKGVSVNANGEVKVYNASFIAYWADQALDRFFNSADPEPDYKHIPYIDGIDEPNDKGERTYRNNNRIRDCVFPAMVNAWRLIQKFDYRFTHDAYLKLWALNNPKIQADFILFDESQDATDVMIEVMGQQTHAQLVFVGDTYQTLYEWRGTTNALAAFALDAKTHLTQSFRFGPAIAEVANVLLNKLGSPMEIEGAGFPGSKLGPCLNAHAILCRSNARAMRELIRLQSLGSSTYLAGGTKSLGTFITAADNLQSGKKTFHPLLAGFSSWSEVLYHVRHDKTLPRELAQWAFLLEDYGVPILRSTIDDCAENEADAECLVSTVHKAKGKEWETVRLADDFPDTPSIPEWRLLYVAATRAKKVLDVTSCPPFKKLGIA